ncbi:unnamed protein product [Pseudo-nitzschia multistriata]|uniref:G-protein coupled receptors family 3 profile domain-containing protein n=1 Tax=Pseudo-nitzschia multistriata TaxID=183589 RepID=A0A448ZH22_9STRA|nr:unnamed protein product [Pseudo-nitzschia multistriata]
MKIFETMNLLVVTATMGAAIAMSSSSSYSSPSFAKADVGTALTRNLQTADVCCRTCRYEEDLIQATLSTAKSIDVDVVTNDVSSHNGISNDNTANATQPRTIRILTWDQPKAKLQAYADLYRESHPEAPKVRIYGVPDLKDLHYEVTNELRSPSAIYDGYVVPPVFLGSMYLQRGGQALVVWTNEDGTETQTDQNGNQYNRSVIDDLLPYYRYNVATFDGKIRGLPILSGSQAMILFRKDYMDALKLPTPKTWDHWITLASLVSNADPPLLDGNGDTTQPVYGACLGLLNEAGCQKRKSIDGRPCDSQTMTYLGMMLASMTQYNGNSTGFMMGIDNTTETGLDPLFQPTLTRVLKWMEDQIKSSRPTSLMEDAHDSMAHFREGRCAWTISINHDSELLKDDNIGFVPLPGSHRVLDRRLADSGNPDDASGTMVNCTNTCDQNCELIGTETLCPFGKDVDKWGRVNLVPFGAVTATIGTVSGIISPSRQKFVKKFFEFVLASDAGDKVGRMEQPLTKSKLEMSDVQSYKSTLRSMTRSPNAAIPFRIPNAYNLLVDLDDRVYEYLLESDYSKIRREEVASSAEESWQTMISMYDARGQMKENLPTSFFYEQSLGVYEPMPASDLYIGSTARSIMWTFAGLGCFASVCFGILVWRYQDERVIRASQPVFLYLICGGAFVMYLSIFTLGIEDDLASYELVALSCVANYWLYSLGFNAVISAMFTKILMLAKALRMPRNEQRIQISKWDIIVPFLVIFGIDFVVLLVWTIIDRQEWVRVPVHNMNLYALNIVEESTYGMCTSLETDWDIIFLLAFNFIILILALVQSYECRRITTEYAESGYISVAIFVFAQIWLIALPLVVLAEYHPRTYFLLRSCTVLLTASAVLLLIFVPKSVYLYKSLRESESDGESSIESSSSSDTTRSSSEGTGGQRRDPRGTIGIRIVGTHFLNGDEIDELQDDVDKAAQRNTLLKDTREKLNENLEERQFARKTRFSMASYKSSDSLNNKAIGSRKFSSSEFCSILKVKPERPRKNRGREQYHK